MNFQNDFIDYVLSGHSLIHVSTYEKDRCIEEIKSVCKENKRNVFVWSIANGWRKILAISEDDSSFGESGKHPVEAINMCLSFPMDSVCIMKDFGPYVDKETCSEFDMVISLIDESQKVLSAEGRTLVFLGSDFKIPNILKHCICTIDFSLPDEDSIVQQINQICDGVQLADGGKFIPNKEILPQITSSCKGMTTNEIADRVALCLRKHKNFNDDAVRTLIHEKGQVIKSSGILELTEPPSGGLSIVGGYDVVKRHILLDKPCFSKEAREFGIEYPKGLMFVGLPGCGKTLLSLAIASEFGYPLVSMDVGSIMSSLVGDSEKNMREAIKICESVAPCCLRIDEIEKGFGGNSDLDGGASRRVFGSFLKYLSDKTSAVYVIATANEVRSLPPEFCRSGRFDAIFGLDLPSEQERKEIISIHLKKRKRDIKFNLDSIVEKTKDFTGSDIENAIKLSLKIAFQCKEKLDQSHIDMAISSVIPLIKTEPERVQHIRDWISKHARGANAPVVKVENNNKRKVTV